MRRPCEVVFPVKPRGSAGEDHTQAHRGVHDCVGGVLGNDSGSALVFLGTRTNKAYSEGSECDCEDLIVQGLGKIFFCVVMTSGDLSDDDQQKCSHSQRLNHQVKTKVLTWCMD